MSLQGRRSSPSALRVIRRRSFDTDDGLQWTPTASSQVGEEQREANKEWNIVHDICRKNIFCLVDDDYFSHLE